MRATKTKYPYLYTLCFSNFILFLCYCTVVLGWKGKDYLFMGYPMKLGQAIALKR